MKDAAPLDSARLYALRRDRFPGLRKIYDKLGVTDRLELALYGLHNKIIKAHADQVAIGQRLLAKPRD